MVANVLIHYRLRCSGFVRFAVTMLSITNEIDDHVFVKFHAKIERDLRDHSDCFWIVTIYMENGCLDDLRDIGTVQR